MSSRSRRISIHASVRVAAVIMAVVFSSARLPTQSAAQYGIADLGTLGGSAAEGYGVKTGLKDLGTLDGTDSAALAGEALRRHRYRWTANR